MQLIFLQWVPWFLRMSRPGEKVILKTIQMIIKMKELDPPSKSLLANVLDMEDDFRPSLPPPPHSAHITPLPLRNHMTPLPPGSHSHISPPANLANHINNQHAHKNGGLFRYLF